MKRIIFLGLSIVLAGCGKNHPVEMGEEKAGSTKTETVKIERADIGSEIKLPGQLKPFEKVDIYPKVNGFVKEVLVDRGSEVKEGQVLLTLEAPEMEQQLQAARAKYLQTNELLNSSRDRYYRLLSASKTAGAVSELDLMNAVSKYQADSAMQRAAEADVNAVKAMEDYLVVRAPFNGIITERNIHPGTLTGPNFKADNKPLLVLQDNKKLRLELFIPEEYASKSDVTQGKLKFSTSAQQGKIFETNIARRSKSLYDEYRSEAIEADVSNDAGNFKPGEYVEVFMPVKADTFAYKVPSTAVVNSTEGKYVVVLDNGKAKFVSIKEGIKKDNEVEIFGNFNGNELVMKFPDAEIKEGATLK